ncbi:MAG: MFS transporter [Planctomycetota bacterium]|nr:MFS transporter [Planctomycetota bacterium]
MADSKRKLFSPTNIAILVAALGYFVDVYDLILFNVVRWQSLEDLGLTIEQQTQTGVWLLNLQLIGMLVGGVFWGILGDLRGRRSVLFGSIILYSVANFLNAGVGATSGAFSFMGGFDAITAYGVLRFVAGVGLAGELGAGVTLVAEISSRQGRGIAVTIIGAVGVVGAVTAGLVNEVVGWRNSYAIGGVMGFALLALRFAVFESGLFDAMKSEGTNVSRGLLPLLKSWTLVFRLTKIVVVGMPIWFTLAILVGLAPKIAGEMGLSPIPKPGHLVALFYSGAIFGDIASGLLSQRLKSRKIPIGIFLFGTAVACAFVLLLGPRSAAWYGAATVVMGFFSAYWIVVITTASELFGTNVRATVTTMTPNLIRASAVPVTIFFSIVAEPLGAIGATWLSGGVCFALAALALWRLPEPFGCDLNFFEK